MVQERTGRVERRLAAILAADVAGYSRLMHSGEEPTHAKLSESRWALCTGRDPLFLGASRGDNGNPVRRGVRGGAKLATLSASVAAARWSQA
jgi:hypothetical protein